MTTHRLETDRRILTDVIRTAFDFLINEYGYTIELHEKLDQYSGDSGPKYYLIQFASVQRQRFLEIVLHRNSDRIVFTIRRIPDGQVADYYDNDNCVRIDELDFLIKHGQFNHMDHCPLSEEKKIKYFKNTSSFLSEYWLPLLKGETWINRKELEDLSMNIKKRVSGIYPDIFLIESKKHFNFLTSLGFKLIFNTDTLPIYERSSRSELIYEHSQTKEGFCILNDYQDYGFRIDHFKNGNRFDYEMILHSQEEDKEFNYIERAGNWLKSKIIHDQGVKLN